MQQTYSDQDKTIKFPIPYRVRRALMEKEDDELFTGIGKRVLTPAWIDDGADAFGWAAALPIALIQQTRKKYHRQSDKRLADAQAELTKLGFAEIDIELARLNDEGLLALASAQAASARAADGYSYYEPHGRPEHDRKFNMKRLRAKRAEVIANLEIALGLIGIDKGRSLYSGDESKRLRDEANKRTAEYLANAIVVMPTKIKGENGMIRGDKLISLAECGNTRYKSLSEFIGFVSAESVMAQEKSRKAVMVTTNCPQHMHPSSRYYDGHTTPRQANRYLSKMNKAARDTLRKWRINEAGVGTKEPHGSAVPHAHLAIFHDAHNIAACHYMKLIEVMRMQLEVINGEVVEIEDKLTSEDAEDQLLAGTRFSPPMSREEFIEGMSRDLIERAFHHHFIDLERDDNMCDDIKTYRKNRLVYGIGVNFKHGAEEEVNGASIVSYVLTYILKSFFISVDKLPKREDFNSDEEHDKANKEAIKQQVEAGGDLAIRAWSSAHGIRTREMWGMPSRSPFKALGKQHTKIKDTATESMRQMILNNQHYDYAVTQGGLNAPRNMAKFKMKSVIMPSSYALRPEMQRRRVIGVDRCEPVTVTVKKRNKEVDTIVMAPAFHHKTRIDGCYITSRKCNPEKVRAPIPNYPSSVASATKNLSIPPPEIQITLH